MNKLLTILLGALLFTTAPQQTTAQIAFSIPPRQQHNYII